jgi:hypothetical protein
MSFNSKKDNIISSLTFNSKNAARDYNYYEKDNPISPYRGPGNCGRCDIQLPKNRNPLRDRIFGAVCKDCKDVLTAEPEEE